MKIIPSSRFLYLKVRLIKNLALGDALLTLILFFIDFNQLNLKDQC